MFQCEVSSLLLLHNEFITSSVCTAGNCCIGLPSLSNLRLRTKRSTHQSVPTSWATIILTGSSAKSLARYASISLLSVIFNIVSFIVSICWSEAPIPFLSSESLPLTVRVSVALTSLLQKLPLAACVPLTALVLAVSALGLRSLSSSLLVLLTLSSSRRCLSFVVKPCLFPYSFMKLVAAPSSSYISSHHVFMTTSRVHFQ